MKSHLASKATAPPSSSTSKEVTSVESVKIDKKEVKKEEKRKETVEDIDEAVENPNLVRKNVQAWIDAHVDWKDGNQPPASTSQSVYNPTPQSDFATARSISFEELSRSVSTSPPSHVEFRRLSLDQSIPDEPEFVKAKTVSFEELVQLVENAESEGKRPLSPEEEQKNSSEPARQTTYWDKAWEEDELTRGGTSESPKKKATRDEPQETKATSNEPQKKKATWSEPTEDEVTALSKEERFQLTLGAGSEDSYMERLEEQEGLQKNEKEETKAVSNEHQEKKATWGEPLENEVTALSREKRFQLMKLMLGVGSEDSYMKRLEEQEGLQKNLKEGNDSENGKLTGENGEFRQAGVKSIENQEVEKANTPATQNGEDLDAQRKDDHGSSQGESYPSLDDEFINDVLNGFNALPPKEEEAIQPSLPDCLMAEDKRKIECQIPLNWDPQDPPTWRALASHVEGPTEIYLNLVDFPETALLKDIQEMFEDLYCKTEIPRLHSFEEIEVGSYWAGCEHGVWYRMKILRILKKTVEVFAVDFGFKTKIDIQDLRHLPDHFMDYYPVIVHCSVYGMKPLKGATDWTAEQKMVFCDLFAVEDMMYLVNPIRLSAETEQTPGEPLLVIMSYAERESFIHEIACEMMIAELCFDDEFLPESEEVGKLETTDLVEGTSKGSLNGEVYYTAEDDSSSEEDHWDDYNPMEEDYFSSLNTKFLDDENLDALEYGFSRDDSKYCRFGLQCRHLNCDKEHVDLTEPLPGKELVYGCTLNNLEFPEPGSYIELLILRVRDPYQLMAMMPNGPVDLRSIDEAKKRDPETLDTLQEALKKHYGPTRHVDFKGLPAIGELMAAFSRKFNAWYRVRVTESGEDMIQVYHIDYARYEKVHITELRKLQDRFVHLPEQAFPVFLSGVGPADGETWSKEASQFLASVVSGRSLIARVDALEPLNLCMHVTLWIANGGKVELKFCRSLNNELVVKNLAKYQATSVSAGGVNRIPG